MKTQQAGKKAYVKCKGLLKHDIDKYFKRLDKTYFRAWRKELQSSLRNIIRKVKKVVPVSRRGQKDGKGGRTRPGEFKRSIKYRTAKDFLAGWIYNRKKNPKSKRGYIGHFIEYGTRSKRQKEGKYFEPARTAEIPVLIRKIHLASSKIKTERDLKP